MVVAETTLDVQTGIAIKIFIYVNISQYDIIFNADTQFLKNFSRASVVSLGHSSGQKCPPGRN